MSYKTIKRKEEKKKKRRRKEDAFISYLSFGLQAMDFVHWHHQQMSPVCTSPAAASPLVDSSGLSRQCCLCLHYLRRNKKKKR
jgi:hypothetical protein